MVSIHETDNVSPDDASYLTRRVETTDQEIDELMLLPPAIVRYIMNFTFYSYINLIHLKNK